MIYRNYRPGRDDFINNFIIKHFQVSEDIVTKSSNKVAINRKNYYKENYFKF
jgi:hypothetical protein